MSSLEPRARAQHLTKLWDYKLHPAHTATPGMHAPQFPIRRVPSTVQVGIALIQPGLSSECGMYNTCFTGRAWVWWPSVCRHAMDPCVFCRPQWLVCIGLGVKGGSGGLCLAGMLHTPLPVGRGLSPAAACRLPPSLACQPWCDASLPGLPESSQSDWHAELRSCKPLKPCQRAGAAAAVRRRLHSMRSSATLAAARCPLCPPFALPFTPRALGSRDTPVLPSTGPGPTA